ncbi:MAG: transketolase [Armatimonadota bacterium]|nr:MAG: transketolase [Armatimonadota bacterium]
MRKAKQKPDVAELNDLCRTIRKDILISLNAAKSGHSGGSLSSVEVMVALYFYKLRHDPQNHQWEGRDRFVLSKGHVCPALYTVMAHAGYLPTDELTSLRKLGSRLQGHPHMLKLPGLETSSGSLGQGLSIAVGMALGAKMDNKDFRVYCFMGDGETDEGQIWEAAMSAAHYDLDNLCGIVDRNRLQIDGDTEKVMRLEPYCEKWASFGWNVIECDGHNLEELMAALDQAECNCGAPTAIIAHTVKGKGISFMENQAEWHGIPPDDEQLALALKELDTKPTKEQLERADG